MPAADAPLIAIHGLLVTEPEPSLRLAHRYVDAVLRAGGIPVAIPQVGGPRDIERLVERVDGLVLSGGDDFDTEALGLGPTHPEADPVPPAQQTFDFLLARAALSRGLPTLGICYGMQVLALTDGATLHQHLPDDRPGTQEHRRGTQHSVTLEPNSKLAGLLGTHPLEVVSRHHQALASVAGPWNATAHDAEGLIEGIEHQSHAFAVGVQWHPELSPEGSAHDQLFRGLVFAAGLAAATSAHSPLETSIA